MGGGAAWAGSLTWPESTGCAGARHPANELTFAMQNGAPSGAARGTHRRIGRSRAGAEKSRYAGIVMPPGAYAWRVTSYTSRAGVPVIKRASCCCACRTAAFAPAAWASASVA